MLRKHNLKIDPLDRRLDEITRDAHTMQLELVIQRALPEGARAARPAHRTQLAQTVTRLCVGFQGEFESLHKAMLSLSAQRQRWRTPTCSAKSATASTKQIGTAALQPGWRLRFHIDIGGAANIPAHRQPLTSPTTRLASAQQSCVQQRDELQDLRRGSWPPAAA